MHDLMVNPQRERSNCQRYIHKDGAGELDIDEGIGVFSAHAIYVDLYVGDSSRLVP